jgi:hypothetical protein
VSGWTPKSSSLSLPAEVKLGADPHSSRGGLRFGNAAERYVAGLEDGAIGIGRDRARRIKPRSLAEIKTHFRLHLCEFNNWPLHEMNVDSSVARPQKPKIGRSSFEKLSWFFNFGRNPFCSPEIRGASTLHLPEHTSIEIIEEFACGSSKHERPMLEIPACIQELTQSG